jgi:hypothetical protein
LARLIDSEIDAANPEGSVQIAQEIFRPTLEIIPRKIKGNVLRRPKVKSKSFVPIFFILRGAKSMKHAVGYTRYSSPSQDSYVAGRFRRYNFMVEVDQHRQSFVGGLQFLCPLCQLIGNDCKILRFQHLRCPGLRRFD